MGTGIYSGNNWTNTTISAALIHIEASYKIIDNLTGTAGYETQSGTSQLSKDSLTNTSFTPHFGTNHIFNGNMDYYYVGNHINSVGLTDIYFKTNLKEVKFNIGVEFINAFTKNRRAYDFTAMEEYDNNLKIDQLIVVKFGIIIPINKNNEEKYQEDN